jgi:hypothetical protein
VTRLDHLFERIRKLPAERQEAITVQIDCLLEDEESGSVLTEAQWAEVKAALADSQEPVSAHDDVFKRLAADMK